MSTQSNEPLVNVKVAHYNVRVLAGWAGLVLSLVLAWLTYLSPNVMGLLFTTLGLIGNGVLITRFGPWRTVAVYAIPAKYFLLPLNVQQNPQNNERKTP